MDTATGEVVESQFEVGAGAGLTVRNIAGKIVVRAAEDGQIRMRAIKRGSERAMANTRIEYAQVGNEVHVETKLESSGLAGVFLGSNLSAVDYEFLVPSDCRVAAKAVSADIEVRGTRAGVSVESVSGDVTLDNIAGSLHGKSVSGNVQGHAVTGELVLHTTSGNVKFTQSDVHSLNLSTVSGDCTIDTPLHRGAFYHAKTVSGSLRLRVQADSGATVTLKTNSGVVATSGFGAEVLKSGRRMWQGRIGGGGATIEMHSVSGNLRLVATQDGHEMTDPTPEIEQSPSVAGAILSRLEAHQISVDEAMRQLHALRTGESDEPLR